MTLPYEILHCHDEDKWFMRSEEMQPKGTQWLELGAKDVDSAFAEAEGIYDNFKQRQAND